MPKLLALQVLRAVAALSVAVLHARNEATFLAGLPASAPWLPWAAGVDVFFVISGFVMVYASGPLFAARGGAPVFAARRVARVLPLYWLVTTLYLGLALASPRWLNGAVLDPGFVAASYLFWPAARPDGIVQPLYGLGWTLNFEMFFYALFAALIGLPRRKAVIGLITTLSGLVVLGRLAPGAGGLPWPEPLVTWTDPLLLEFGAGAALGLLRAEGATLGVAARSIAAALALGLFATGPAAELSGVARPLLHGIPAIFAVIACGFGPERPSATTSLATRIGTALGDASYALYLTHPFALRGARTLVAAAGLGSAFAGWRFLLLGLTAAVVSALVVHRWIERPLTRATRRWLERRG